MSMATRSQLPSADLESRRPTRLLPSAVLVVTLTWLSSQTAVGADAATPRLAIVSRTVSQDQGSWLVDYRLRYLGTSGMVVTPTEVNVKIEGWVSNSRVGSHATPRWSSPVVSGASGLTGLAEVITAADESLRCRERAIVQVWTEDAPGGAPAAPVSMARSNNSSGNTASVESQPPLSVGPEGIVRLRVRLDHAHFLYGDYDPLLGTRAMECQIGAASFRDALPLDREQYLALPRYTWPAPPEDRRDTGHFVSGPDSLHLEAHVPGNQYYRFPERPVRYSTKVRLRYWYFIASGSEGECRARIAQYKDTPTAWKVLSEGGQEECLSAVGRWVKVERIFRTEPDATTLALDFRISGSDVGEMWIDDVTLEPVGFSVAGGP